MAFPGWRFEYSAEAAAELRSLSVEPRRRAKWRARALRAGPDVPGAKKLEGHENLWRISFGRYRIVYQVDDSRRVSTIIRVRRRPTAYEGLERPRHE